MLFFQQLDAYVTIWIVLVTFIIGLGYLLRLMYHKVGMYLSVKAGLSVLSAFIIAKSKKIDVRELISS